MLHKFIFNLLLIFCSTVFAQASKHVFVGGIKLNDTLIIPYKVNFELNKGVVKGFSLTDIGGDHETRSNIFGEYDENEKTLSFREIGIVYTKSPVSQNDFCFLNTTIKNIVLGKTQKTRSKFVGLFSDNTSCIDGELLLNVEEKAEKRAQKLVTKINKLKRVPDSIKQKLNSSSIVNALKMNVLKNNTVLSVFSKSKYITMEIFDAGKQDGDKITITVNGTALLTGYEAKANSKVLKIPLVSDKTKITLKALNEGNIAPNTVMVKLIDDDNTIKALSNLKQDESTQIDILK